MFDHVVVQSWWHTLSPVTLGHDACTPGHKYGPAVRAYYLMHYVFEGEGVFYREGQCYHVNAGDIFVIRPGELTTYQASFHNPWHYCWLGFTADNPPEFLNQPVLRQMPVRQVFERIAALEGDDMDGKAFSLTYDLLWKLSRAAEDLVKRPSSYAEYAKTYLEANYMGVVSIQALADTLHIDRRYLTARFREAYGLPPQAFLMNLRMERAREFLIAGHSVTEAAAMAGFADLPGFSRQYKAHFGMSPSQQKGES